MTKHVTCIKRYTGVQSSHHMPKEADTIVENDELEEEIGQPEPGPEESIPWDPTRAPGGLGNAVPNRSVDSGTMGPLPRNKWEAGLLK